MLFTGKLESATFFMSTKMNKNKQKLEEILLICEMNLSWLITDIFSYFEIISLNYMNPE